MVDELAGALPIIAGASAPSLAAVIARVQEVERLGIRQVMIQAPKAIGTDADAVTAFYAAIATACPGIEIILQNAPAPRGSDLSPAAVLAVAHAVPAIRYIKEETIPSGGADFGHPHRCPGSPGRRLWVEAGARFVIDEALRGACGAMPAVEFADIHARMWAALAAGREVEARQLYERTLPC